MSRVACGSLVVATLAIAAVACSSAPTGGSTEGKSGSDGTQTAPVGSALGSTAGAGTSSPSSAGTQAFTETGTITDFETKQPVTGATVTAGAQTATTAADGTFSLTLQQGDPFQLSVTANGYATLLMQQTSLAANYDLGTTTIVPNDTATLLTSILTGYEATLGVLSVAVVPTGACASEDGATLSVSPAGSAKVAYFSGGLPSTALTSVKGGEFPSAVIYNVAPSVPLTVTVTHPTCTQAPFPFTQDGVDYTGVISTQAGEVTGFARIFLQ